MSVFLIILRVFDSLYILYRSKRACASLVMAHHSSHTAIISWFNQPLTIFLCLAVLSPSYNVFSLISCIIIVSRLIINLDCSWDLSVDELFYFLLQQLQVLFYSSPSKIEEDPQLPQSSSSMGTGIDWSVSLTQQSSYTYWSLYLFNCVTL